MTSTDSLASKDRITPIRFLPASAPRLQNVRFGYQTRSHLLEACRSFEMAGTSRWSFVPAPNGAQKDGVRMEPPSKCHAKFLVPLI